jgi:hypothetical protein
MGGASQLPRVLSEAVVEIVRRRMSEYARSLARESFKA